MSRLGPSLLREPGPQLSPPSGVPFTRTTVNHALPPPPQSALSFRGAGAWGCVLLFVTLCCVIV